MKIRKYKRSFFSFLKERYLFLPNWVLLLIFPLSGLSYPCVYGQGIAYGNNFLGQGLCYLNGNYDLRMGLISGIVFFAIGFLLMFTAYISVKLGFLSKV